MANEDEMKKSMSAGAQLIQTESYAVDSSISYIELQANYADGNPNVILMSEKLPSKITAEKYADTLEQQLKSLNTVQYKITKGKDKAKIAGQEYISLSASATYATVSLIQDYYIRVEDGRAIYFIFTYTSDTVDKKDALIAAFQEYK